MENFHPEPPTLRRWFATDEGWTRFNQIADTLTPQEYERFLTNLVAVSIEFDVAFATVQVVEEAKARL